MKYMLLISLLLFNISYAIRSQFIQPRNSSSQIVDIGFQESQGKGYLSKEWIDVLSEIRQTDYTREYKKRYKTSAKSCISDGTSSVCPYEWQECPTEIEYTNGTSKRIENTVYSPKIKTISNYSNGSVMKATYSLEANRGAIDGTSWKADILRGSLSQGVSGQELYNQGFVDDNGKFAMKVFNFGSGCGGLTIRPIPNHIRTIASGGSTVVLQDYINDCSQTISSGDGQWATVLMTWDQIPSNITWVLDDYGYISEPDEILGFLSKKCPTGYTEVSGDPEKCKKTIVNYEYSCPKGEIGNEDENYRYTEWTIPLISLSGDSPNPPNNNCQRRKYTCPIDGKLKCTQTQGTSEASFEKVYDQGKSIRHDEVSIGIKDEETHIEQIPGAIETKIDWSDKITSHKTRYKRLSTGDKIYCDKNSTYNSSNGRCEKPAIPYTRTIVSGNQGSLQSSWTDSQGRVCVFYGADVGGCPYNYNNQTFLTSYGTTMRLKCTDNSTARLYGISEVIQNYTCKVEYSCTYGRTPDSNGYCPAITEKAYKCPSGFYLNGTTCSKSPVLNISNITSDVQIVGCSNGGDFNTPNCALCPTENWRTPSNCSSNCDTDGTIKYEINENAPISKGCIFEYDVRECPNNMDDHGTDNPGNTCTDSNRNIFDSNCDDCSITKKTRLCPYNSDFPNETFPNIPDPENWFDVSAPLGGGIGDGVICQKTTKEYHCRNNDYTIEDNPETGLCKKHYTYFEYQCNSNEWTGPAVTGEDCKGSCEGPNCLCNDELPPEDNCYKYVPIYSGHEPVTQKPAQTYKTKLNVTSSFNLSEYGVQKGYTCVDENGYNCGYDVYKISGEDNKICFHDKVFFKECIDVQGCKFSGEIELSKDKSFSAITINPETNELNGYVAGELVPGSIKSSCVMNGQVGKKNEMTGGFNAVKMDQSRMSFWNSYSTDKEIHDKKCIIGHFDKENNKCVVDENQKSYPAILTEILTPNQPEQSFQYFAYGSKLTFSSDDDGKIKIKGHLNFLGSCPVGNMINYEVCRYGSPSTSSCTTPGFSRSNSGYCEKDISISSTINSSQWFADVDVPLDGSPATVSLGSAQITFQLKDNVVNISSNQRPEYTHSYILLKESKKSCNEGDFVSEDGNSCTSGTLLEGEDYLIALSSKNSIDNNTNTILYNNGVSNIYNFSLNKKVLSANSGWSGSLTFRIIKGKVNIFGSISNDFVNIKGEGNKLKFTDPLDPDIIFGNLTLEWSGSNIQISGGRIVKSGKFDFRAPDYDYELLDNQIKIVFGSAYNSILTFTVESNQYCDKEYIETFNSCVEKKDEVGFIEFVPNCEEVSSKDPKFFYEGFKEKDLLSNFNSIINKDGYTYARSNNKMTESKCKELSNNAGWKIATINFEKCDKGWTEINNECVRNDENKWYNVIEAIYNGELNAQDLFLSNNDKELEISKVIDNVTGEKGIFIYAKPGKTNNEGFFFKPDFKFNEVDLSYIMQGTDNGYKCTSSDWIPLNGPGSTGGITDYLSPCLSGYNCIQGTSRLGRDKPISVNYKNESFNSDNNLLTWSGSNTIDTRFSDSMYAENCAKSPNIPDNRAGTMITKLLVKKPVNDELKDTVPVDNTLSDKKLKFLNDFIPDGSYLDIFGSNGQSGQNPNEIFSHSCNGLLQGNFIQGSSSAVINLDGTDINVHCEKSSNKAWTLAGKINGSLKTFAYDKSIWTNNTLLNENDTTLNHTEMKNKAWTNMPFTSIKLVFETNGDKKSIIVPVSGNSLSSLFSGDSLSTNISRESWKNLISNSSLQSKCNKNGVNIVGGTIKLRLGILGNQENDCLTPDSFIGVGSNGTVFNVSTNISGNYANGAPSLSADNGGKNLSSFVYVYLINDNETNERPVGTNEAWCIIEKKGNRSFKNLNMCVKLEEANNDVKFHCSPITCDGNETCQLAKCVEGKEIKDGINKGQITEPDFLGTKQKPDYDFTGICSKQSCDANLPYTASCGRDFGCDTDKAGIIKKDGKCFQEYCTDGDLVIDKPRSHCKKFSCPKNTIDQGNGKCLVQ